MRDMRNIDACEAEGCMSCTREGRTADGRHIPFELLLMSVGLASAWFMHGLCLRISLTTTLFSADTGDILYRAATLGEFLCFIGFAVFGFALRRPRRVLRLAATFLVVFGSVLFEIMHVRAGTLLTVISGLLLGAMAAALLLSWALLSSRWDSAVRGRCAAMALVFGFAGYMFVALFPGAVFAGTLVPVPGILSVLCLWACCRHVPNEDKLESRRPARSDITSLLGLFVCTIALCFIAPAINYVILADELVWDAKFFVMTAGQAFAALVVWLLTRRLRSVPGLYLTFFLSAPVLVVLLLAAPFAGHTFQMLLVFIGGVLYATVYTMCLLDSVGAAEKSGLSVLSACGCCMAFLVGVYFLAEELMVNVMTSDVTRSVQSVFVVLVLAYIFGIAFLCTARHTGWGGVISEVFGISTSNLAAVDRGNEKEANGTNLEAGLRDLGLTNREIEVVHFIVRGHGVPAIAEELCVSQSTVRSHLKRVYRVCNVHSRQELVGLCERLETTETAQ